MRRMTRAGALTNLLIRGKVVSRRLGCGRFIIGKHDGSARQLP